MKIAAGGAMLENAQGLFVPAQPTNIEFNPGNVAVIDDRPVVYPIVAQPTFQEPVFASGQVYQSNSRHRNDPFYKITGLEAGSEQLPFTEHDTWLADLRAEPLSSEWLQRANELKAIGSHITRWCAHSPEVTGARRQFYGDMLGLRVPERVPSIDAFTGVMRFGAALGMDAHSTLSSLAYPIPSGVGTLRDNANHYADRGFDIKKLGRKRAVFFAHAPSRIDETQDILEAAGFNAVQIIEANPRTVEVPKDELRQTASYLLDDFGKQLSDTMLKQWPELMASRVSTLVPKAAYLDRAIRGLGWKYTLSDLLAVKPQALGFRIERNRVHVGLFAALGNTAMKPNSIGSILTVAPLNAVYAISQGVGTAEPYTRDRILRTGRSVSNDKKHAAVEEYLESDDFELVFKGLSRSVKKSYFAYQVGDSQLQAA